MKSVLQRDGLKTVQRIAIPFGILLFALLVLLPGSARSEGKFSGYMLGDYYYVISHNNSALENQNGFWFRRIYFTYDYEITDEWKSRFRLELNSPGDFKTKDTIKPYIKDAYLAWKKRDTNLSLILGMSSSPAYEYIENFWGYRAVERTALDLYKMEPSRDLGIALKGAIDKAQKVSFHLFVGNGQGTNSELNKEKKFSGSLLFQPQRNISIEFFTDYSKEEPNKAITTYQGFLGWKNDKGRIGAQFSHQILQQGVGKADLKVNVGSLFGVLKAAEKISVLGRVDRVSKALPWASGITYSPFNSTAPFTMVLAGIDYSPTKNVKILPHIMTAMYDETNGVKPDTDTYFRMTCYWSF